MILFSKKFNKLSIESPYGWIQNSNEGISEGNTTFQECTFNYITVDGKEVFTAQVARAIWKDNKIINERFYWHP